MTDRFEEALNFINFKMSQEYIETEEYYHIFKYHVRDIIDALTLATEVEQLRKERDELASALNEYYIMYGDRSIISRVDDLLEKAGILND